MSSDSDSAVKSLSPGPVDKHAGAEVTIGVARTTMKLRLSEPSLRGSEQSECVRRRSEPADSV